MLNTFMMNEILMKQLISTVEDNTDSFKIYST